MPYCFEVNEGELFAFAGLWEGWKDLSGKWVKTCSILTTTKCRSLVHDRMPVILDPELRSVARSRNDGRSSDFRTVEALPRKPDAELSREHES